MTGISKGRLAAYGVALLAGWTMLLGLIAAPLGVQLPPRLAQPSQLGVAPDSVAGLLGDLSSAPDEMPQASFVELPPGAGEATTPGGKYDPANVGQIQRAASELLLQQQVRGPLPTLLRDMSAALAKKEREEEELQRRLVMLQPSVSNYNAKDADQLSKAAIDAATPGEVSGALAKLLRDLGSTLKEQQAVRKGMEVRLSRTEEKSERVASRLRTLRDEAMQASKGAVRINLYFGQLAEEVEHTLEQTMEKGVEQAAAEAGKPWPAGQKELPTPSDRWRSTIEQLKGAVEAEQRLVSEANATAHEELRLLKLAYAASLEEANASATRHEAETATLRASLAAAQPPPPAEDLLAPPLATATAVAAEPGPLGTGPSQAAPIVTSIDSPGAVVGRGLPSLAAPAAASEPAPTAPATGAAFELQQLDGAGAPAGAPAGAAASDGRPTLTSLLGRKGPNVPSAASLGLKLPGKAKIEAPSPGSSGRTTKRRCSAPMVIGDFGKAIASLAPASHIHSRSHTVSDMQPPGAGGSSSQLINGGNSTGASVGTQLRVSKQGWLTKFSKGGFMANWNRRAFVLVGSSLYYARTHETLPSRPQLFAELHNCEVLPWADYATAQQNVFGVHVYAGVDAEHALPSSRREGGKGHDGGRSTGGTTGGPDLLLLAADTGKEKFEWMHLIEEARKLPPCPPELLAQEIALSQAKLAAQGANLQDHPPRPLFRRTSIDSKLEAAPATEATPPQSPMPQRGTSASNASGRIEVPRSAPGSAERPTSSPPPNKHSDSVSTGMFSSMLERIMPDFVKDI